MLVRHPYQLPPNPYRRRPRLLRRLLRIPVRLLLFLRNPFSLSLLPPPL